MARSLAFRTGTGFTIAAARVPTRPGEGRDVRVPVPTDLLAPTLELPRPDAERLEQQPERARRESPPVPCAPRPVGQRVQCRSDLARGEPFAVLSEHGREVVQELVAGTRRAPVRRRARLCRATLRTCRGAVPGPFGARGRRRGASGAVAGRAGLNDGDAAAIVSRECE